MPLMTLWQANANSISGPRVGALVLCGPVYCMRVCVCTHAYILTYTAPGGCTHTGELLDTAYSPCHSNDNSQSASAVGGVTNQRRAAMLYKLEKLNERIVARIVICQWAREPCHIIMLAGHYAPQGHGTRSNNCKCTHTHITATNTHIITIA